MNDAQYEKLVEQATDMGREHGKSAGTWVTDGNTDQATYRRILQGYEDGDPEIMDMAPSPLSGQWADGLLIKDVLGPLGVDQDDDAADDLLQSFEDGYSEGYWDQVIADCRYQLQQARLTVEIELGNDAMQSGADMAEALRRVATRLDQDADSGMIQDENGNTVGSFTVR